MSAWEGGWLQLITEGGPFSPLIRPRVTPRILRPISRSLVNDDLCACSLRGTDPAKSLLASHVRRPAERRLAETRKTVAREEGGGDDKGTPMGKEGLRGRILHNRIYSPAFTSDH